MEKLIELLDKFRRENKTQELFGEPGTLVPLTGKDFIELNRVMIISKEYEFIKRLVENDKINREKFGNSETKSSKYSDFELSYDTPREDYTNILLMELSISENPIEFLAFILK